MFGAEMPHLSQRIFALCVCLRGAKSLLYIFGVVAPRLARVVATIHATFRFQLAKGSQVSPKTHQNAPSPHHTHLQGVGGAFLVEVVDCAIDSALIRCYNIRI